MPEAADFDSAEWEYYDDDQAHIIFDPPTKYEPTDWPPLRVVVCFGVVVSVVVLCMTAIVVATVLAA